MRAREYSPCFVSAFALLATLAGNAALADPAAPPTADQVAANPETPPPATRASAEVEDIVVTAQKRTEKLKDVPVSISAVSGSDLQERRVEDVEDIARSVPGVSFNNLAGSEGMDNIIVRGVSSTSGSATVGIYIDDVSITTKNFYDGSAEPQLFDLDRLEVLRGPQGTLYGASSEGGSIRFVTKQPDLDDFSAEIGTELSGTEHGGLNYKETGFVNEPIVPGQSAVRASLSYTDNSGYIDHFSQTTGLLDDSGINQERDFSFRMTGKFLIGDSTTITPGIFFQRDHADDNSAFFPAQGLASEPAGFLPQVDTGLYNTDKSVDEYSRDTMFLPSITINHDFGFANLTSVTGYFFRQMARQENGTFYNSTLFAEAFVDVIPQLAPFSAETNADIGNLRSPVQSTTHYGQFSQELRLASDPLQDGDLPIKWVTGLYYSDQQMHNTNFQQIPGINAAFLKEFGIPIDDSVVASTYATLGTVLFPDDIDEYDQKRYDERQEAVFGQVDYDILPDLHAAVGARFLEARDVLNFTTLGFYQLDNISPDNELTHSYAFTPKFTLSYDIDPQTNVYTSAAKGVRIGGPENSPVPFGPNSVCAGDEANFGITTNPLKFSTDKLWTYEIGSKNRVDDNQISLDTSVYYTQWDNVQQQIYLPTCGYYFTDNVGDAGIYGGEAEASYRPRWVPGLTLGLSASYTHAQITRTDNVLTVQVGQRLTDVPYDTYDGLVQYNFPLTDELNMTARLDYDWTGRSNGSYQEGNSNYYNPPYAVANASIGIVADRYEVALFAKNLFDNETIIQKPEINTVVEAYTVRPLTVGLSAKYKFGP
jgi:iron complex outermembrane receptor protein